MPPPITPIPWTTVENAIQAFFTAATGLVVIWGNQPIPRPAYPYGTITIISGPTPVGIDEDRVTAASPDLGIPNPGGALSVVGNREITVSFQVKGAAGVITPTEHARNYVGAALAAFDVPLYANPLRAAGCAVRQVTSISLPDQQVADSWFSRAVLDVRLGLASNIINQPIDVIESVHVLAVGDDLGTLDPALIIDQTIP